jgi:hypothetical protein
MSKCQRTRNPCRESQLQFFSYSWDRHDHAWPQNGMRGALLSGFELKVQPQFGPVQHSTEGPLWLRAWRRAEKALQRRGGPGSVSLAHGRGLRRCHILYRYRGIKDVLIALSSLQQHTTHPLAHHRPTNTHSRRHKLEQ